ncbi:hypothetical protein BD289DRAFT_374662 [Coniella lustricola]|uniref:Adenosine deaminase domain-containing protein n=1 Tax=Coniella lustricola TaxID=2025994 RepID=A0A2T2ZZD9_9PEZI|nr:hypothetical protein BD289DRAFT_374662 [Coniella lustricola]
MTSSQEARNWLRALPKCELHLHLEGTVTPETLVILSARHDSEPLTLEDARALYQYKDFRHFLSTFKLICDRLLTPDDYALIAHKLMRNLAMQGVVHAEVYISCGNILRWKPELSLEDVMTAVEGAVTGFEVQTGVPPPSMMWIVDATRQWGTGPVQKVFCHAAKLKDRFTSVVGVGVGGDEAAGPVGTFREAYRAARKAGLRLTAHAGEATGPVQGPLEIRTALEMDVERIGHGLAAQHDEDLMTLLAQNQVPVEINVTSNVLTGCCPSSQDHPLPKFFEKGIRCVLCSDDPAMFGSWCLDEYVLVHETLGFSLQDMKTLASNSVTASFLEQDKKESILKKIRQHDIPVE